MRVLHVISSLKRSGGGPCRSAQGLVAGLNTAGVEAWLLTLNHSDLPWIKGVDRFCNADRFEGVVVNTKPDMVHLHGIWNRDIHHCAVVCRAEKVPYIIAPRGMLEPWSLKQKWLKKRIARFLYQDKDLKFAAALHATAESEAEQFRKLGFTNYCIISPNGVNVPAGEVKAKGVGDQRNCRRALFVSRMHHKKGVLELVEAWTKTKPGGWVCELVYTVNGDEEKAYEAQVKQQILECGFSYSERGNPTVSLRLSPISHNPDFILTGSLSDDQKWEAFARADLFVLPTYSENFGIVVAEALYAGVPVITTKGTPWSDLKKFGCGWWIDFPPIDSLSEALESATNLSQIELREMGDQGRKLVEEKYSWPTVCKPMISGYEKILGRGA